jgi:hypothetical protein
MDFLAPDILRRRGRAAPRFLILCTGPGRPIRRHRIQYPVQGYSGYGDSVGTDFISDEMRADC